MGVSKFENGDLTIDWEGDGTYSTFFNSFELQPVPSDYKFTACYKITGGVTTGLGDFEISSFTLEQVFFDASGAFSFQSILAFAGAGSAGFSRDPKANGTYTIDGYRMELLFDDGKSLITAFGLDDEGRYISIGNEVYYKCK